MLTKCPTCGELVETDTPGTRFGTKPGHVNIPGSGTDIDLVEGPTNAYFHPECSPAAAGYFEGDVPPRP